MDYIENITLTTEGSQKIFNFNYKPNMIFAWYFVACNCLKEDSDVELTNFSGTLTIDEKNNIVKETFTADYRDKVIGATAKYTFTGEYSNNNQELVFPEDLSSYE